MLWPVSLFELLGNHYRMSPHMAGLKIGGFICCFADVIAIWALIRCLDLARGRLPSKWKNAVLGFCALINVTQLFPKSSEVFFLTMFFVFMLPYLLLIYSVVVEARYFVGFLKETVARDEEP